MFLLMLIYISLYTQASILFFLLERHLTVDLGDYWQLYIKPIVSMKILLFVVEHIVFLSISSFACIL